MRKIIFLDVDGVIATEESLDRGQWTFVDHLQDKLGHILDATGAELVISSSWREATIEATKEKFKNKGFLFVDKIVGITIRGYSYLRPKVHLSIPRGVEIKQWIDTHLIYPWYAYPEQTKQYKLYDEDGNFKKMKSNKVGVDFNYVILDDDSDMLLEHRPYFIKTHRIYGLSEQDAIQAIKILNNENSSNT